MRSTSTAAQEWWATAPCPPGHDPMASFRTIAPGSFTRLLGRTDDSGQLGVAPREKCDKVGHGGVDLVQECPDVPRAFESRTREAQMSYPPIKPRSNRTAAEK